jgi:hypothetical protein
MMRARCLVGALALAVGITLPAFAGSGQAPVGFGVGGTPPTHLGQTYFTTGLPPGLPNQFRSSFGVTPPGWVAGQKNWSPGTMPPGRSK